MGASLPLEEAPGFGTRIACQRGSLRSQDSVVELAIVLDISWSLRQGMHLRPCCRGASSQALAAANRSEQLLFYDIASNARTGIMMHLPQIRSEPQSPRFRQLS